MDLIINIILSIVFTIIDIYILKFYFENKDINIFDNHYLLIFLSSIFLFLSNWHLPKNYFINISSFIIFAFILLYQFKNKINIFYTTVLLSILRFFSTNIITIFCEWIFNTLLCYSQFNKFFLLYLFCVFLIKYLFFALLIIFSTKHQKYYRIFKNISIIISVFFCICILIYNDRLFYFKDVGRTFVLIVVIYNAMLLFFDRYQTKHEAIEQEMEIINQNIKSEKNHIIKKNEADDTVRDMRHDLKNNFTIINGYLNDGKIQDAQEYIEKIVGKINEASSIIHSGYSSLDSIINDKISIMKEKNINYEEMIAPINIGNIEIEDLSLLIGIALDNAIEAAEKVEGLREVKLKIKNHKSLLMINIQNSVKEGKRIIFGRTSKLDKKNHGFGVKKIYYLVNHYDGNMEYNLKCNLVSLRIILNIE